MKPFFEYQLLLILKVGVANAIKNLVMMNLRKQLGLAERLYNKVSLQK